MPDDQHPSDPKLAAQAAHGAEAALRLQVSRQRASLDRQAVHLKRSTTQIANLTTKLRDRDAQIDILIQETQTLHQEVADLRGSTSWRITAPLRALMRAIMRLRGSR